MRLRDEAYLLSLWVLSLSSFALPAHADSDGCFCVSRGYIAFELRSFHTQGLEGEHVLRVVRFGPGRGIYAAGEVMMEDFQVHKMTCKRDRVEIAGWDKGYVRYTVDVATPDQPRVLEHTQDPERQHESSKEGPAPGELGRSQPGVVHLESADPEHKYQLVLSRSESRIKGGVEYYRKAELVQIEPRGNISQHVLLYEDRFAEYGD
jgi:hypothetical protein